MTVTTTLAPSLTAGKINLWVEDSLTKEYLSRCWQPEDVFFRFSVGGSSTTVQGAVHDLRENGVKTAFGFIDRDLGKTNREQWLNPECDPCVLRTDRLEIENYLLDWEAMAGCQANQSFYNRTKEQIEDQAKNWAAEMVWWMACRRVLHDGAREMNRDYPDDPPIAKAFDLQTALDFITNLPWCGEIVARAQSLAASDNIRGRLEAAYADYDAALRDGSWTSAFSGKEVFQRLSGWICHYSSGTKTEKHENFAKSIADWQRENQRVPDAINAARMAFKSRVGI